MSEVATRLAAEADAMELRGPEKKLYIKEGLEKNKNEKRSDGSRNDLDSWLLRFERFAETSQWQKESWPAYLSALLTGRALDCFCRLSTEDAKNYDAIKLALQKRYNLTEDGYRLMFRQCKPEEGENPGMFVVRLKTYLERAPLQSIPVVDVPFKRVAVDLVGPIDPTSEDGHRYILTLVDYATRYPEAVPLKRIDAETVAEALVNIYSRLGVPKEILTDQGTQFMSIQSL
ncbi:hypothetical protein EGW08_007715 [Elysia chlorotica]|uniref:Integrase catalytic domain-containing protein n=1 Tax=Elysia chlorotica TaxID=188477 RepID=A0A433TSS2_ELYCH|nr:hypothetical protein EGW08_007715 [Elysia chlorotica]